jgi:hypothetical protein
MQAPGKRNQNQLVEIAENQGELIPMSVQDETKARRIPGCWRGASEAHIRSDLQRASNEASSPEDKRISLILNANWNKCAGTIE